jgi:hypothetical protein
MQVEEGVAGFVAQVRWSTAATLVVLPLALLGWAVVAMALFAVFELGLAAALRFGHLHTGPARLGLPAVVPVRRSL